MMVMMKSPEKKTVRSSEPDSKQNLHNLGRLKKRGEGEEEEEEEEEEDDDDDDAASRKRNPL